MSPKWTRVIMRRYRERVRTRIRARPGRVRGSSSDQGKRYSALRNVLNNALFLTAGVLSAGFGLKGFLLPNNFIDGGAVGISLLIAEITFWPLSILIVCINLPFIIMGITTIGKGFALRTALAIGSLALAVAFIPYPQITQDKLLVAVFGGFFLGAGIGLAVRGGGVIDGTEILAIAVSRRFGVTMGDVILVFNILIFSVGAWLLSVEAMLYSILTYLAASRTVDFFVEGIDEYTGVTIISNHAEAIRKMIVEILGRGVTIYKGERGFGSDAANDGSIRIVFTVITRLEINKLKTEIEKIDLGAFVVMHSIRDTKGGWIKKHPLKH